MGHSPETPCVELFDRLPCVESEPETLPYGRVLSVIVHLASKFRLAIL